MLSYNIYFFIFLLCYKHLTFDIWTLAFVFFIALSSITVWKCLECLVSPGVPRWSQGRPAEITQRNPGVPGLEIHQGVFSWQQPCFDHLWKNRRSSSQSMLVEPTSRGGGDLAGVAEAFEMPETTPPVCFRCWAFSQCLPNNFMSLWQSIIHLMSYRKETIENHWTWISIHQYENIWKRLKT